MFCRYVKPVNVTAAAAERLKIAFTLTDIVQHYLSMSFLRQTQLFSAPYIQYDLVAAAVRTHHIQIDILVASRDIRTTIFIVT